jgi:hypothetical protein
VDKLSALFRRLLVVVEVTSAKPASRLREARPPPADESNEIQHVGENGAAVG